MEIAAVAVALVCVIVAALVRVHFEHVVNAVQALRLYVVDGRGDVFVIADEVTRVTDEFDVADLGFRKVALGFRMVALRFKNLSREPLRARCKKAALDHQQEVRELVENDMHGGDPVQAFSGYRSISKRLFYDYGDNHGQAAEILRTITPDNVLSPGAWDEKSLSPDENKMIATYAWPQSPRVDIPVDRDNVPIIPSGAETFVWQEGEGAHPRLVEAWTVRKTNEWQQAYIVRGVDARVEELDRELEKLGTELRERHEDAVWTDDAMNARIRELRRERENLEQARSAFARVLRRLFPDSFKCDNIKYGETETRNVHPVHIVPPIWQSQFLTHPKVQRLLGIKSFEDQTLVCYKVPKSFWSWLMTFRSDSHVKAHRIGENVKYVFYTRTGNKDMTNPQSFDDFEGRVDDTWNISKMVAKPEALLGKGAVGKVYVMKSLEDDKEYAVKFVNEPINTSESRKFRNNIELTVNQLLEGALHPNLVAVRGLYFSCDLSDDVQQVCKLAIAMDKYPINLEDAIPDNSLNNPKWDRFCRRKWTKEVHTGLEHLHGLPAQVLHGDLKPQNVMLSEWGGHNAIAKVADFGHSCIGARRPARLYGTQGFVAPELMRYGAAQTVQADMYALGVVSLRVGGHNIPGTTGDTADAGIPAEEIPGHLRELVVQAVGQAEAEDMFASDLAAFAEGLTWPDPAGRMGHAWVRTHSFLDLDRA